MRFEGKCKYFSSIKLDSSRKLALSRNVLTKHRFCKKKILLGRRVEYVMDGSMDGSVSESVSEWEMYLFHNNQIGLRIVTTCSHDMFAIFSFKWKLNTFVFHMRLNSIIDCSQSPIFPWGLTGRHLSLSMRAKLGRVQNARYEPNRHYPRAVSLASRVQDGGVELNDLHLRSHGKIGDCEQSNSITALTSYRLLFPG